jgi:hypothetical protein
MKFAHRALLAFFCSLTVIISSGQQADQPEDQKKAEQEEVPQPPKNPPGRKAPRRPRREDFGIRIGEQHGEARTVFFSNFILRTNETASDVVVIGGDAEIDGNIRHSLTVIGGSAKINGNVGHEAVIVLGGVTMGPESSVGRQSVFIGGPFKIDPEASLNRDRVQIEIGNLGSGAEWFRTWITHGIFWGRLLTIKPLWPWAFAGAFFALYALLVLLFPRAASSVVQALEQRPVASLCAGILQVILWAPLTLLLIATVVGILAIPFFQIGILFLFLFGKAGLICFIGKNVAHSLRLESVGHPIFSLIIGAIVLALTYMVPVIGLIAFFIATPIGFGAAFLALTSSFKKPERQRAAPVPVVLKPTVPPPTAAVPSIQTAPVVAAENITPAISTTPPVLGITPAQPDVILMARAGFWKRLAAALLDLILIGWLLPIVHVFFIPLAIAYFIVMWTWKGTTIGSIIMGLKIVRTDGRPINFAVALVRSLSSLLSGTVLFLGFLWAGWDREKQAWHDKIAGTVVVRMPKGMALV